MSGSTYTWIGGGNTDWTNPVNWIVGGVTPESFPNGSTVTVIDDIDDGTKDAIISGGTTITVATISIGNDGTTQGGHLIVGGSPAIGGDGNGGALVSDGTIVVTSTNPGGAIVGGNAGVVSAPVMQIDGGDSVLIGGGGTFDIPTIINNGGIYGDGGRFDLGPLVVNATTVSGTGFWEVAGPSTLEVNAATAQQVKVDVANTETATVIFDLPGAFTGSLNLLNPNSNVALFFKGETPTSVSYDDNSHMLVISDANGTLNAIPFTSNGVVPLGITTSTRAGYGEVVIGTAAVCYARGTHIRTPGGEVAIEDLRPGDQVVTLSGEAARVEWIGHRAVDCTRHPDPKVAWPIRIKAEAFGPSLPHRDLLVSPAHGLYHEGVLIPALTLVNGTTVVQEQVSEVEYFHIELARHDIVLAEGLPAETYLENNDRDRFENADGPVVLHPSFAGLVWDGRGCAPLHVSGPVVEALRAHLAGRAGQIAVRRQRRRRRAA